MKRVLASALVLGLISGFGLVGCGETAKDKVQETTSGPGGTTTVTSETSVKKTGDNAPAPGDPGSTTTTPAK